MNQIWFDYILYRFLIIQKYMINTRGYYLTHEELSKFSDPNRMVVTCILNIRANLNFIMTYHTSDVIDSNPIHFVVNILIKQY